MAEQIKAELIVEAMAKEFEALQKRINNLGAAVEESSKSAQKSGMGWTELKSKIDLAIGAAKTVAGVFKEAFDLGREGASIVQTGESFDRLNSYLEITPGLLGRLQDASRGTISDLDLMSSTTKLLQGSSMELGKSLGEATPQLLEIAKAANKLNPSLGDTAFLYESISLGIKRSSPMILDNLGLMIKVGDANQKYADSLGISVEAMTDEQKKMALLNAVLEQGDRMINQVGGSTMSAVDSFDALKATLSNLADMGKAKLYPFLSSAATALSTLITRNKSVGDVLRIHESEVRKTSSSYEDYIKELQRSFDATGLTVRATEDGNEVYRKGFRYLTDYTDQYDILSETEWELAKGITPEMAARQADLNDRITNGDYAAQGLSDALDETAQSEEELAKAAEDAATALEKQQQTLADFAIEGGLKQSADDYKSTLEELVQEQADLNAELEQGLKDGWEPTGEEVANLNEKLAENAEKQAAAAEEMHKATAEMIFQAAASNLDANAQIILANALGLMSDEDFIAMQAMQDLTTKYDTNMNGAIDAAEATAGYAAEVATLVANINAAHDKKITLTAYLQQTGNWGALSYFDSSYTGGTNAGHTPGTGMASGGSFTVPPGYPGDSFPMNVQSGEKVKVTPAGKSDSDQMIAEIRTALMDMPSKFALYVRDALAMMSE